MKIKNTTNEETKEHLLKWCNKPNWGPFSWPTDPCGYEQHIKFVVHRNKNWNGGSNKDFVEFVRNYALSLEEDMK